MTWITALLFGFAVSTVTLVALSCANHFLPERRIHVDLGKRPAGIRYYVHVGSNLAISGLLIFAFCWVFHEWMFHDEEPGLTTAGLQWVLAIFIYDLLDYFLHRVLFHGHGWLQRMHAKHHVIRRPTAFDSLFLGPLETALSLFLLALACVFVGPVTPLVFCLIFSTYTVLNISVHSGLNLPFFPFRALTYMAKKHDLHHSNMRSGNYASMTPLFDILFKTHE